MSSKITNYCRISGYIVAVRWRKSVQSSGHWLHSNESSVISFDSYDFDSSPRVIEVPILENFLKTFIK